MDEIIRPTKQSIAPSSVKQEGEKNLYIENNNGGVVNINYSPSQQLQGISAEQIIAIQKFSKQYYQLIVTCDSDIFNTNIITVPTNRALCQYLVPNEIFDRCSSLSDEGINELMTFPAIICCENTGYSGETDSSQLAMYCYIRKITLYRSEVKIVFQPISVFPQAILCDKKNAIFFGLEMDCALTDLNHSAWSVHKTNIFEACKEAGLNMPSPQ